MNLDSRALTTLDELGYAVVPGAFKDWEVSILREQLELALAAEPEAGRVMEEDRSAVRALHGCHLTNPMFARLARIPRLLGTARRILAGDVYLYQFKINTKAPFTGAAWPWHQDYVFWLKEDGMPTARAVTLVLMLDEVNEFNGPLYLIPGSHRRGCIDVAADAESGSSWEANVAARLKYTLSREHVSALVGESGMVAPKGAPGTLLIFHSNTVHGSPANISPFQRRLLLLTYNRIDNAPIRTEPPRPNFLVTQNAEPLEMLDESAPFHLVP